MYNSANPWTIQSMEFSRPEYWSVLPFPSPGDLPNPGMEPRSPTLQTDSLPAEPQGKPKNTGVGSLSLLQRIFPTQELIQALLHCRWILHQLSHEGSTRILEWVAYPFSRGSSQPRDQAHISCISCIGRQILYLGLGWVFMAAQGLSVVVASEAYSSFWCPGFSLQWLLLS